MPIARFYLPGDLQPNQQLRLPEDVAHHAIKVLRIKEGDEVMFFNGKGGAFTAKIEHIRGKKVTAITGAWQDEERESSLYSILVLAVSTGEKMDYAVQKAVELGVNFIQPLMSNRCVVRLNGARAERRVSHWQSIAIHACEQCHRTRIPEVAPIAELSRWLAQPLQDTCKIVLNPAASQSLRDIAPRPLKIVLLAGPEGGFSENELQATRQAGFIPVRLGARVLRTETAPLAALAAIQMLWGDF
jgi:16S rRNA (uracil1498-N3)-methyltransferase